MSPRVSPNPSFPPPGTVFQYPNIPSLTPEAFFEKHRGYGGGIVPPLPRGSRWGKRFVESKKLMKELGGLVFPKHGLHHNF